MRYNNKAENYTEFFYKAFRNILLVSIPLVIIFVLILGFVPHSSAEISGSTDNVSLTLSTSCTVNAVVTSEHTVSLNGGQLDNNVGNTKLSAFCNDNNGYSIYAVGSSGDTDGNTDLINTVNESYNIHTGVYDDSAQTNPSSWAMKLTAGTGTGIDPVTGESVPITPPIIVNGYDNYSAIPNVYTQVAKRTSGTSMTTDTSVSGSYLNTTYQIYANSAQPAGTYNGKVKYVIVHPNSSHNTIPDLEAAFAMAGKQKYPQESGAYYAMQDMTTDICNSVSRNGEITSTQLVDLRDNKLYWVAKLADGHCWMTQNLDFNINANATLSSETTDLNVAYNSSTGQYAEYNNGYTKNDGVIYWEPANTAITINFNGTGVGNRWSDSNSVPYSANKTDSAGTGHASLGNYYNWTTAIASNDSADISTQYSVASNSICPKGWRLPIATNHNQSVYEFGVLLATQGITNDPTSTQYTAGGFDNIRKAPLWFVLGGAINGGSLVVLDTRGVYWSSVVDNTTNAYYLSFDSGVVQPSYSLARYTGRSVRCIAR